MFVVKKYFTIQDEKNRQVLLSKIKNAGVVSIQSRLISDIFRQSGANTGLSRAHIILLLKLSESNPVKTILHSESRKTKCYMVILLVFSFIEQIQLEIIKHCAKLSSSPKSFLLSGTSTTWSAR